MSTEPSKVVHPRTSNPGAAREKEARLAEAGARFESYVRAAMSEGDIDSMAELGRRSGIAAPIWYSWFRGEKQPRRTSLTLAGQALERTPDQLLAVWEGDKPRKRRGATETPDELVNALLRQSQAIEALVEELRLSRAGQVEATEIAFQALGALGVDQARKGTPAGSAPEVPSGTGR